MECCLALFNGYHFCKHFRKAQKLKNCISIQIALKVENFLITYLDFVDRFCKLCVNFGNTNFIVTENHNTLVLLLFTPF